ncbi:MAG: hypothetical protein J6N72_04915, partial [Psychrobacter sp.]|nr:hypothetical protein [Psychrobacter sp.]
NIIPYHEASQLPATPAYSPTAIVVQRYDDGTAYVVFDGAVDMKKDNFVISSDIPPDSVEKFKDFFSIPPVA